MKSGSVSLNPEKEITTFCFLGFVDSALLAREKSGRETEEGRAMDCFPERELGDDEAESKPDFDAEAAEDTKSLRFLEGVTSLGVANSDVVLVVTVWLDGTITCIPRDFCVEWVFCDGVVLDGGRVVKFVC